MALDYGILITQPGVGVVDSKPQQQVMNTRFPFFKIDTQKKTSNQTILMLITNNPPEPPSGSTNRTQLYKFAHGYTYVPSIETLYYVTSPGAATANTQAYFQNSGLLSAHSGFDSASIYASADATNIYFYCEKFLDTSGSLGQPNDLTGTTLKITVHVFADDIGI